VVKNGAMVETVKPNVSTVIGGGKKKGGGKAAGPRERMKNESV